MKTLLTLCLAVAGLVGFTTVSANAAAPTVAAVESLPSVVHINQTLVVETGHRRHYDRGRYYHPRHNYRRRYYYRHHRRYYY